MGEGAANSPAAAQTVLAEQSRGLQGLPSRLEHHSVPVQGPAAGERAAVLAVPGRAAAAGDGGVGAEPGRTAVAAAPAIPQGRRPLRHSLRA